MSVKAKKILHRALDAVGVGALHALLVVLTAAWVVWAAWRLSG